MLVLDYLPKSQIKSVLKGKVSKKTVVLRRCYPPTQHVNYAKSVLAELIRKLVHYRSSDRTAVYCFQVYSILHVFIVNLSFVMSN